MTSFQCAIRGVITGAHNQQPCSWLAGTSHSAAAVAAGKACRSDPRCCNCNGVGNVFVLDEYCRHSAMLASNERELASFRCP